MGAKKKRLKRNKKVVVEAGYGSREGAGAEEVLERRPVRRHLGKKRTTVGGRGGEEKTGGTFYEVKEQKGRRKGDEKGARVRAYDPSKWSKEGVALEK